ncbi:MAG: hypothetical protein IH583_06125 [Candidatus Aminicenantes bacterium]|nr:hypothetical protein [Candidatus Aminicenantes bacterium]
MKPRKILIKIGLVLLIAVTAVVAVRAILNYTEGRLLARTLADLKAQGVPLNVKELTAPCPEADNAARLWRAAANLLAIENEDKALLGRAFQDLVALKPLEPSDRSALEGIVAKNQEALGLLHAMADKPCFLYRDPRAPFAETIIPGMVKMIQATRLMGFEALLRAEKGDVRSATERIRSGLGFASKVAQEATMITQLIAVADTRMLASFLEAICRGRKVDEEILLRLIADLEPKPWRVRLAQAIKGERVFFIEMAKRAASGARLENEYILFGEPSILNDIRVWLIRPLLKTDIRRTLPKLIDLEAQALHPYYESRGSLRAQERQIETLPWYAYMSKLILGNFEAAFLKEAQLEATLLAARTGLACKLFENRTGAYPESLEALVPNILAEVPIDPFTGKPFVYRREGEGFIVYSLGSNEKDDGGRSTYMITQMVMEKDDDWTWKEDR